ncbi:unnamed protein product [Schistosoma curassoni]|nr:unnamed protein product [Schistosoma curassoni]CAH8663138.1 unnamed protein product [Schistosoma curassoni]
MALSGFSDFDELSSCETLLYHNGLSAISFTHVFDRKKIDSCFQSLHTSDVPSSKTCSPVIIDGEKSVSSNSRLVLPHSKPSFHLNHEDRPMLAGPSFSENKTVNFNLPSLPINVTALSSTFPQSISAVQQLCSVKGTTSKKRRLFGEQDRISALMSLNEFEDDYKSEAHRISSKTRLSQLTYSRASSDSKLYPETVDSVLPLIKPVSIVITDCFLESEEDDIVDSGQLVKKRRKNSVVLDEEKNVSRDNSETLEPPVSSLQGLSPIPYRCEDDVAIPGGVCSSLVWNNDLQNSSRSLSNLPIIPKGRPSVTFAPIVVYFDSPDNSQPRVSVGPIAHEESDLGHFDCELSEKLIHQEGSLTQSENKENIGSFFESTALSSTQDSKYPSPSTSSLSLSRIKLPWCTPYDCQFLPFKSKRPPTKSFIQSDGHLRRSKRLRVPATHDRNKVVVYEPDKDEYGLVYQKPIGLAILPDPDEINRRQKFLNRLKRCQNNRTQFLRNEKINRAKRLQKLAKRYRSLKGAQKPETDPCMRIQLDPDVEWISHTETQLPIGINDASPFQQVIYPENAQFPPFKFSTMEYSSYVVPALSGAFPSRTKTRIPCFEMNANLTRIVSKEQERRQLHYDPNAINVFKMMSSPPVLMNNNSSYSLYAVQIAKFAIPLTKPCIVYIPKGIPYKFLNATKENLNLCRIRYVLT